MQQRRDPLGVGASAGMCWQLAGAEHSVRDSASGTGHGRRDMSRLHTALGGPKLLWQHASFKQDQARRKTQATQGANSLLLKTHVQEPWKPCGKPEKGRRKCPVAADGLMCSQRHSNQGVITFSQMLVGWEITHQT